MGERRWTWPWRMNQGDSLKSLHLRPKWAMKTVQVFDKGNAVFDLSARMIGLIFVSPIWGLWTVICWLLMCVGGFVWKARIRKHKKEMRDGDEE